MMSEVKRLRQAWAEIREAARKLHEAGGIGYGLAPTQACEGIALELDELARQVLWHIQNDYQGDER